MSLLNDALADLEARTGEKQLEGSATSLSASTASKSTGVKKRQVGWLLALLLVSSLSAGLLLSTTKSTNLTISAEALNTLPSEEPLPATLANSGAVNSDKLMPTLIQLPVNPPWRAPPSVRTEDLYRITDEAALSATEHPQATDVNLEEQNGLNTNTAILEKQRQASEKSEQQKNKELVNSSSVNESPTVTNLSDDNKSTIIDTVAPEVDTVAIDAGELKNKFYDKTSSVTARSKKDPATSSQITNDPVTNSQQTGGSRPIVPNIIQKSYQQKEAEALVHLSRLQSANNWSRLEQEAERMLSTDLHKSTDIAAMLLHSLTRQEKFSRAEEFWRLRKALGEPNKLARAKLLVAKGDSLAAIEFLSASLPLAERELAMYAGLLQKKNYFKKSEQAYQQLLINSANNGVYWLGLALSLDSQRKSIPALSAYQRAHILGGHKPTVTDFIADRIDRLSDHNQLKQEVSQW